MLKYYSIDVAYDAIREIEMDIGSKLHYGMLNRPTGELCNFAIE